jgi:hypothetical protein
MVTSPVYLALPLQRSTASIRGVLCPTVVSAAARVMKLSADRSALPTTAAT